jgi:hypothetical protein
MVAFRTLFVTSLLTSYVDAYSIHTSRQLQYEEIAGYQPRTVVTDQVRSNSNNASKRLWLRLKIVGFFSCVAECYFV